MTDSDAPPGGEFAAPATSVRVVEAVADADGVDPLELEPPLYEAVDPVALDRLFEPAARSKPQHGQLTFTYRGYEVTVHSAGHIELE